jgi:acetylornithine deacetylase
VPPGRADLPTVVLNRHLDTVGVTGMPEPFTPPVEGDRLYGRGAADMKGGVAALVAAAEHLVAAGAPVRPGLLRLSVGLEGADVLVDDLRQAIAATA